MAGINITFSLKGFIREDEETQSFVSYCPALDLYSAGRTRPDAKAALQGAIFLFIKNSYDRNILGGILHARGFEAADQAGAPTLQGKPPAGPDDEFIAVQRAAAFDDMFDVEVPIHLIMQQQQQAVGA